MADGMMFADDLAHLDKPLPLLNYNAPTSVGTVSKIIDCAPPKTGKSNKAKKRHRHKDHASCSSLICVLREAGII